MVIRQTGNQTAIVAEKKQIAATQNMRKNNKKSKHNIKIIRFTLHAHLRTVVSSKQRDALGRARSKNCVDPRFRPLQSLNFNEPFSHAVS